jgi:hypothetical protein
VAQSVSLSDVRPIDIVLDWIIDDGQPKRPNRSALFSPEHKVFGIASGPNKATGRAVTVVWARSYSTGSEPPPPTPAPRVVVPVTEPFIAPAKSDALPMYRIGETRSASVEAGAPYDSASALNISSLGCNIDEIKLVLSGNGHYIDFSRTRGQYRDHQKITLPYQVLSSTVSARYNPKESDGLLSITLGKPRPLQRNPLTGENVMGKFTVWKNPSATNNRVMMSMERGDDFIRFFPAQPSKYDTEFTVVINGTTLEFRSLYEETIEDIAGNPSIRAVNSKQSLQLPSAPTREEVTLAGSSVKVHIPQNDDVFQSDASISISLA